MSTRNRRFLLRERPAERMGPENFELIEDDVPRIGENEALIRTLWISLDPTNRMWASETPTYLPPVAIGDVMRAVGLGRVVESKHPAYPVGQLVAGLLGWQEWVVASEETMLMPVPEIPGVSTSALLGVLGTTGLTAWIGVKEIGQPSKWAQMSGVRIDQGMSA